MAVFERKLCNYTLEIKQGMRKMHPSVLVGYNELMFHPKTKDKINLINRKKLIPEPQLMDSK